MSFASWTVAILILLCTAGILLFNSEKFSDGFHHMNDMILLDWLAHPQKGVPVLKIWFVCLCIVMVILGINLVFCSWNRFFRLISGKKTDISKYIMLFVHILFGFAALCHFIGFISGYKYKNIYLNCGQSFNFDDVYSVRLKQIHFIDNFASLKLHHRDLTANNFHYNSNYADIQLIKNGDILCNGRIFILKPFCFSNMQITLKRFVPLAFQSQIRKVYRNGKNISKNERKIGVQIIISKNPVLYAFFIIYPLMILGIFFYLGITWRE